jgi:hypothetical protein
VDLSVSLDYVEKRKFLTPPGLELRPFGRPARSQLLYRLSYPGSLRFINARANVGIMVPDIFYIEYVSSSVLIDTSGDLALC